MAKKRVLPSIGAVNVGSDMSADEVEFALAVEKFHRRNYRLFPTNSEILAILISLGYRKVAAPGPLPKFKPRAAGN